jgi:hypothetical protein
MEAESPVLTALLHGLRIASCPERTEGIVCQWPKRLRSWQGVLGVQGRAGFTARLDHDFACWGPTVKGLGMMGGDQIECA